MVKRTHRTFAIEPVEHRRLLSSTASLVDPSPAPDGAAVVVPYARAVSRIDLADDVHAAVRENDVPAGAAGVIKNGSLVALGASGRRVVTKKFRVSADDRFHLGSSGKAMTSTMVGLLIEQGKLGWDTTIAKVFPELKGKVTKSFEGVTVWQLMTNRSGIRDDMSAKTLVQLGTLGGSRMEQRAKMVPIVLKTGAAGAPGRTFEYSNFAYAVLGAMAERVTKTSFESLMSNHIFKVLGMDSAGFGAQGKDDKVDQPRGHDAKGKAKTSGSDDLLPYLAPAGLMSMSMTDWGKFLTIHMGQKVGRTRLVQAATLQRLQTPYDGPGTSYAAGWVVTNVIGTKVLSHDGTNGNWYSTVQLIPSLRYAAFNVINAGGARGMSAAYDLKATLLSRYPFF